MYTSEISHFSMEKSAHILGLGYQSVVKVPVDSRKRMDLAALRSLIDADIKDGNIPFLIVGTVGTTDFGSIDPLEELNQIARQHNMWLPRTKSAISRFSIRLGVIFMISF